MVNPLHLHILQGEDDGKGVDGLVDRIWVEKERLVETQLPNLRFHDPSLAKLELRLMSGIRNLSTRCNPKPTVPSGDA